MIDILLALTCVGEVLFIAGVLLVVVVAVVVAVVFVLMDDDSERKL